jgi:osmotically-inducible protein OsmY
MRKRVWAAGAAVAAIAGWLGTRPKSVTKNAGPALHRGLRRHPSTTVDDSVLADRIRSTIGPLEKQLHNARINVTVEDGVAILHGEVETPEVADEIEEAVRGVAGVRDIRSHLSG